ncbi:MAG: GTPase Era [Clostridia bacterium]|nr:GTPase Era [Clostridia bacterium]MBQ9187857.1 GTPase Era [Clostridia bacterium]
MIAEGYKSGFFSIIGCPNVGKSTLLNTVVGQKIAIVTDRAQTTRNRITGVLTEPGRQMIFLDTPGMTHPRNKLGEYMQKVAENTCGDTEAILFMIDATQGVRDREKEIIDRIKNIRSPKIAVINKRDIVSALTMQEIRQTLEGFGIFEHILSISAKSGDGVDKLLETLRGYLVDGPQYFPDDMVTDQPERVIVAEMIREKTLQLLREEIPHGIGVGVDKMALRPEGDLMDVWATLYCERESHKGIIIGRGGKMLKRIGTEARKDIEWLLGVRVNLQLWIKVKEDWRNRQQMLNELGYRDV